MDTVKDNFSIAFQTEMKKYVENYGKRSPYFHNPLCLPMMSLPSHIHIKNDFANLTKELKITDEVKKDFFYFFKYGYLNAVNFCFSYKEDKSLDSLFWDFCADNNIHDISCEYDDAKEWFCKGYKLALYQQNDFILSSINDKLCKSLNAEPLKVLPSVQTINNSFNESINLIEPQLLKSPIKLSCMSLTFKIGWISALLIGKDEIECAYDEYFSYLIINYFGADEFVLDYFDWFKQGVKLSD